VRRSGAPPLLALMPAKANAEHEFDSGWIP
jgi:hypothetical protein